MIQERQQECLDQSGGGSRAIACFAAYYQEWDEELNYYYGRLRTKLNDEDKGKLKTAQLAWIKSRDETGVFNSALLDKIYADKASKGLNIAMVWDASKEQMSSILNPSNSLFFSRS